MVQIAGFGFDFRELHFIAIGIVLIISVFNIVAFQEKEGFIPVLDKRIIGFPECNTNLQNPANNNLTLISFCIAPSKAEIESLSKSLDFQGILNSNFIKSKNSGQQFIDIVAASGTLVIQLLVIFPMIIKLFLTGEIIFIIIKGIGGLFNVLHSVGLF